MKYDTYVDPSVALAIDLINTYATPVRDAAGEQADPLPPIEDMFARHGMRWNSTTNPEHAVTAQRLADRLHQVFTVDDDDAVAVINDVLASAGAMPQISGHDDERWHLHYSTDDAPPLNRLAITAAMGLATVVCSSGTRRLGRCDGIGCSDVYVDTSRNNRRRFCSDTCSNRAHVAAHRARQRAQK